MGELRLKWTTLIFYLNAINNKALNIPVFFHAFTFSARFPFFFSLDEMAENRSSIPCAFSSLAVRATDSLWDTVTW